MIGALFFFILSINEDIWKKSEMASASYVPGETCEKAMGFFRKMDFAPLSASIASFSQDDHQQKTYNNLRVEIELYSKDLIDRAFTECNGHIYTQLSTLLLQITQYLPLCDISMARLLLIPIEILMSTEYDDVELNRKDIEMFYTRVGIFNVWRNCLPRLWSLIAHAYHITDQMAFTIRSEISSNDHPLSDAVNTYLRSFIGGSQERNLADFSQMTESLPDIWDLVDTELFLTVFPNELYLSLPSRRMYNISFARKIAVACIVKFVNDHQISKKTEGRRSNMARQRDSVVRCCIAANLNIPLMAKSNPDLQYFWSHLRKLWLRSATTCMRLDSIYDHIQGDHVLVNQLFLSLIDDGDTASAAELLTCDENLRSSLLQKRQFIDDPNLQMHISIMQAGRRELWLDQFGPKQNFDAFILPFELASEAVTPGDEKVFIVDQPGHLSSLTDMFQNFHTPQIACIDLYYKIWRDVALERPIPNILAIAINNTIILVMLDRIGKTTPKQRFLKSIFSNTKILKILPGWQTGGKFQSLAGAWATDPFELDNSVCTSGCDRLNAIVEPCIDIARSYMQRQSSSHISFEQVVEKNLGVEFCNFEENSNWAIPFLRNSQLHYIASRTWLSLQLFHALDFLTVADIKSQITSVDLSRLAATGMYSPWRGPNADVIEWIRTNREKIQDFEQIVSSTQEKLRENLKDLRKDSTLTRDRSFSDITLDFSDDGTNADIPTSEISDS